MTLNDLVNTIEKMQADLSALKQKALAIQPAIEALAGLNGTVITEIGINLYDIRVGNVLISSEEIITHNRYTVPAGAEFTVRDMDDSHIPLLIRWVDEDGEDMRDWVRIQRKGEARSGGVNLQKTRFVN